MAFHAATLAHGRVGPTLRTSWSTSRRSPPSNALRNVSAAWSPRTTWMPGGSGFLLKTASGLLLSQPFPQATGEHRTQDRRHPEHPQLLQRPAADQQCGAGAARRIHRGVGDGDADEVDQRECETDGERREAHRRAFAGGAEYHE